MSYDGNRMNTNKITENLTVLYLNSDKHIIATSKKMALNNSESISFR